MNNFELDEQARQLADTHTGYQLARMVLDLEREMKEQKRALLAARELAGVV